MRFAAACCLVLGFCLSWSHEAARGAEPLPMRWVYLQQNLQVADNVTKAEEIARRAKAAGYNAVVLADYKLGILDRVPDFYFKNAARFRKSCDEMGMEIIPAVGSFGYSGNILAHDPNLAEGLPVKNAPFRAAGGVAVLDGERPNESLVPGDFEKHNGHKFAGWDYQDDPGVCTFADETIHHSGGCSLRIERSGKGAENCRVIKAITVRPFSQYHVSLWIRTAGFEQLGETKAMVLDPKGHALSYSNLGLKRDQDWTEHHVVFNSLDNQQVRFYAGSWGCKGGKLWLDDIRLVESPLVNLVRRPGCPLVVTDEAGQTVYTEGRDYGELRDPQLGQTPYAGSYDIYHAPPPLKILAGGRIKEGQKLHVSYFHTVVVHDDQVACSLTEPKVFELFRDEVVRVDKLFSPRRYFLSHDEIRIGNWSAPEVKAGKSAGEVLAENVRRCTTIIREVNPQAKICIWSDMFDPHHNAVRDYYLVRGDLAGSWEGLSKDVTIVNWNSEHPRESLPFFAGRGHQQVLAGFYDGPPKNIIGWLDAGKGLSGVDGVMYTTWQGNYRELEAFAQAAWGGKK